MQKLLSKSTIISFGLLLGSFFILFLPGIANAAFADWNEDFEGYTTGAISGQGLWTCQSGSPAPQVSNTEAYTSSQSFSTSNSSAPFCWKNTSYDITQDNDIYISGAFYPSTTEYQGYFGITDDQTANSTDQLILVVFDMTGGGSVTMNGAGGIEIFADGSVNVAAWNTFIIYLDNVSQEVSMSLNGSDFSTPQSYRTTLDNPPVNLGMLAWSDDPYYFDEIEISLTEPGANTDTTTRIEWVNPPKTTPSATTTSQTVDYEFNYYLNSGTDDADKYTHILLQLCSLSYSAPCEKYTVETTVIPDSYENVSVEIESEYQGYYLGLVNFWNGVSETTTCNWWNFGCENQNPEIGSGSSNRFNIATTTLSVQIPGEELLEGVLSFCEDTNFFVTATCNTIAFFFIPNPENLEENINETMNTLKQKLPFAFYYNVRENLDLLETATSTEGTNLEVDLLALGTITVINWSEIRTMFDDMGFNDVIPDLIPLTWVIFSLYVMSRVILEV